MKRFASLGIITCALAAAGPAAADVIYATSFSANSIYSIDPSGTVTTHLSTGLNNPVGIAMDVSGNLVVANRGTSGPAAFKLSKITPAKVITAYPGAASSLVNLPEALAFDRSGNLFVSNFGNKTVTRITPTGTVTAFATFPGDPPQGLAVDASGNVYVAHGGTDAGVVSKYDPSGVSLGNVATGLYFPTGLSFDAAGNLYISTEGLPTGGNGMIYRVTPAGAIMEFARAETTDPSGLTFDHTGNLYATNFVKGEQLTQVTPGGTVSTFATGLNNSLYVIAVPEPSGVALFGLVGITAFARPRRRRVGAA